MIVIVTAILICPTPQYITQLKITDFSITITDNSQNNSTTLPVIQIAWFFIPVFPILFKTGDHAGSPLRYRLIQNISRQKKYVGSTLCGRPQMCKTFQYKKKGMLKNSGTQEKNKMP